MAAKTQLDQATAQLDAGHLDAALETAKAALAADPENLDAMLLCGRIMRRAGRLGEAERLYRLILAHYPDCAPALGGLGAALGLLKRYTEAVAALRQAVAAAPDYFEAWAFLGEALLQQGQTAEAMDCLERSLEIRPHNPAALSSYLFSATFDARFNAARVFELNRDWARHVSRGVKPFAHTPNRPTGSKLRIAYVSDELYERVTARFIEPVLAAHNRGAFDIHLYSTGAIADDTTERLKQSVDGWHDLAALSDAAAAAQIRDDGIDVLVLFTSYRAESRALLAYKPAPVQVCYSNLVSTTGLDTVDYLISETLTDPPGSETVYTEELVRLTNRNIYQPPPSAPAATPPPAKRNGYVTFGSFNNLVKIGPDVIALWSEILRAVPDAKLVMKSTDRFADTGTRTYFLDMFHANGVDGARVLLLEGDADLNTHLARYGDIDVALDPFPCNGGTTSCEALWMGVPVVTMAGDTFMGKQGVNYLTKLDMTDLIAVDGPSYVNAAIRLASDVPRLSSLRSMLRGLVEERLFDPRGHVAELETAYIEMYRRFQSGHSAKGFAVAGADVLD